MNALREYLLSVAASAILISLLSSLVPEGGVKRAASCTGSMVLLLVVLSPVLRLDQNRLVSAVSELERQICTAEAAAADTGMQLLEASITERTEAYILDKAAQLGMNVSVRVETEMVGYLPQPVGAELRGTCTLLQQEQLSEILEEDLGIPREAQRWMTE